MPVIPISSPYFTVSLTKCLVPIITDNIGKKNGAENVEAKMMNKFLDLEKNWKHPSVVI